MKNIFNYLHCKININCLFFSCEFFSSANQQSRLNLFFCNENFTFFYMNNYQFSNFTLWTLAVDWMIKTNNSKISLSLVKRLEPRAAWTEIKQNNLKKKKQAKKKRSLFKTRELSCLRRSFSSFHFQFRSIQCFSTGL